MYDDGPEEFDSDGGDLGTRDDWAGNVLDYGCFALMAVVVIVVLGVVLEALRRGFGP